MEMCGVKSSRRRRLIMRGRDLVCCVLGSMLCTAAFHRPLLQRRSQGRLLLPAQVRRPRLLFLIPCKGNPTAVTLISSVAYARKQESLTSAKFLDEHMLMPDKQVFCMQNHWFSKALPFCEESIFFRGRFSLNSLHVRRSSFSSARDLKTSATISKENDSFNFDENRLGQCISSIIRSKYSSGSDVKRNYQDTSSSVSKGKDPYSSDLKRHGQYTSSTSKGRAWIRPSGDRGRRSSNKGFDVLEELIPSIMPGPRDPISNANEVSSRSFVEDKGNEQMSQISMVYDVEKIHGSISLTKDKDPHRLDILQEVIDDGDSEALIVSGASRRGFSENKGNELSQSIVRDIKKRNISSTRKTKASYTSNADQGHRLSKKGFDGLYDFIPSTRASPTNRKHDPRRSPSKEEVNFKRRFVEDKQSRLPQTDVEKGSDLRTSIGKAQDSNNNIARSSIASNKSFVLLNEFIDNNLCNDPGRKRETCDSSNRTTSKDDGGVEQRPFESSFLSTSSPSVSKSNIRIPSQEIQSNESSSLWSQSNEKSALQNLSNEGSFLQTPSNGMVSLRNQSIKIPSEKPIFGSNKDSELERPSLRGQEVLWALQQAAIEKAKRKQKKRKGSGKVHSKDLKSNQVDFSMETKNWEDMKPIVIKQEWKLQIEELERRISDLRRFKASA